MKVEIITIGDELLDGSRANTNAAYLGEGLSSIGGLVTRSVAVGDQADAIEREVAEAIDRADIVVTTGGLGVTADDRTRQAVSRVMGARLELDETALERVRAFFESRGETMPEINISQAMIPEGARPIENRRGTAPGLMFERDGTLLFVLPGPPHELRSMLDGFVMPFLEGRGLRKLTRERLLRTTGISESRIAERVGPTAKRLARTDIVYLPSITGVDIKVIGRGETPAEADKTAESSAEKLAARLEPFVYARGRESLEKVVGYALSMRHATLSVAESCTGGGIGRRVTRVPGSSDYFKGGVIAYSNELKQKLLKVKAATLRAHGAVSEETAAEMAAGVRKICGTDYGVSVTGIAGPTGGSREKPVGTVYVGVQGPQGTSVRPYRFSGARSAVRGAAEQAALELLRRTLLNIEDD
jgi:nicotinamide-nucleotide amidase